MKILCFLHKNICLLIWVNLRTWNIRQLLIFKFSAKSGDIFAPILCLVWLFSCQNLKIWCFLHQNIQVFYVKYWKVESLSEIWTFSCQSWWYLHKKKRSVFLRQYKKIWLLSCQSENLVFLTSTYSSFWIFTLSNF